MLKGLCDEISMFLRKDPVLKKITDEKSQNTVPFMSVSIQSSQYEDC
jgi:hypothetical protein